MLVHSIAPEAPSIETLRARYEQARAASAAAASVFANANDCESRAELALLQAEGKGGTVRARWLAAHLGGDRAETSRMLDLLYPRQAKVQRDATPEEVAALEAEAQRLNGSAP